MLSIIYMKKNKIITKEKMISYCKGENESHKISINDDLESMFEDLTLGERPSYSSQTYFLPKLTEHEMALTDMADRNYFQTFYDGIYGAQNPDVDEDEMRMSESKSKFIHGDCQRKTYRVGIHAWERKAHLGEKGTLERERKAHLGKKGTLGRKAHLGEKSVSKSLPEFLLKPISRCSIQ